MREILEQEIKHSMLNGDTTVLAEILSHLDDDYVFGAISDAGQTKITALQGFLDTYGIKVGKDEDLATVELMMDNHYCFEFKGQEYYINDSLSGLDDTEQELYDHLYLNNAL